MTKMGIGIRPMEWRNHHGSVPGKSSDAKGQVGAVYPSPTAELVDQGRDSSHGLLIASGIFMRLVPGSPAMPYLGGTAATLKGGSGILERDSHAFELIAQTIRVETRFCGR